MKRILTVALIATSLIACKSKTDDITSNKDIIILGDSSKLIPGNSLTDTALLITTNADGTTTAEAVIPGEEPKAVAPKPVVKSNSGGSNSSVSNSNSNNSGSGNSNTGSGSTSSSNTNTSSEKKGISKAAKGAIIGGVGGAAAGAIIGRNGKGAAIGAAAGAAGGYIIGRKKDKKDGRVQ